MRFLVVALLLIRATVPALADDKADRAKAAEHYRQGKVFENAKAYDKAIVEFEQAYALDHVAAHLFNIGIAYELKPDLKNALDYFQRYLTAEPTGPKAAEARTRIKTDTQQLLDEETRRRADEERIAAEQKKLKEEQDAAAKKAKDEQDAAAKKASVIAHLKQAAAYAQAGAWAKAGEEHRAAATIDGDPQHLIDAADAFHKQPDDVHAREALLAYLEKVPVGDVSDKIRVRVAELTKSIEKADAERQRIAALGAKPGIVATTPRPKRRTSFGFELHGGLYGPQSGKFITGSPPMEIRNNLGAAVGLGGLGALIDLPVLAASHIHLGLRVRYFRFSYECGGVPQCPSKVSGTHAGPAVTLEPSVYHHGRVDVYAVFGFSLEIPLGKGKISFEQGAQDQDLNIHVLAAFEFGLGVRAGPVSVGAVVQTSFNNLTADVDVGQTAGIIFTAGWALPR